MRTAKKNLFLFISLSVFALLTPASRAQAPSGVINIPMGANTPVYDLTGYYDLDQSIEGAGGTLTDLSFSVYLNNGPGGALTGTGTALVTLADGEVAPFAASYVATGRVSGGGNNPVHVTLTVRLVGNDTVVGIPDTRIRITVTYNLTVDPVGLALNGSAKGSLSLGGDSARINSAVGPFALPSGADGTWSVQMSIVPLNRLDGTGVITVGSGLNANAQTIGRVLQTGLTGSYSVQTGVSRVTLNGLGFSRGSSLKLNFFSDGSIESFSGTILGQKVLFTASSG